MGKLVELREILVSPREYGYALGELVKVIYEPKPEKKAFVATGDMTGREENQEFCMEASLECFAVLYNGITYLIANQNLRRELILYGKTGYENGEQALTGIANLSSNMEIGAQAETWNEATVGILKKYPSIYESITSSFWTTIKVSSACRFGLQGVYSSGVYSDDLFYYYSGSANSYDYNNGVRPLVSVPSDIQINLDEIGKGALHLIKPVKQARISIVSDAKAIDPAYTQTPKGSDTKVAKKYEEIAECDRNISKYNKEITELIVKRRRLMEELKQLIL